VFKLPDIETLRLCSVLATFAFGLVFAVIWHGRRSDNYLLYWSGSSFLYGAVLIGFRLAAGAPGPGVTVLFGLLGVTDVLLLCGIRHFDGLPPFRAWMTVPLLTSLLGHAAPAALSFLGWAPVPAAAAQAAESLGLSLTVGIVGVAMIRGRERNCSDGRIMAGAAILAYIPGYALAAAGQFGAYSHASLLAMLPMLMDQLLLGVLNLGLLAMPARRAQAQLREAALRDPLTRAWNRAGLEVQKQRLLRPGAAVVAIDVDHFKRINDSFGHAVGDEVLVTISREVGRCASSLGGELARIGGDEFLVILPATAEGAAFFAERMRASLPATVGSCPEWSVSVGAASVKRGEEDFLPAMARADARLYHAKAAGWDRVAARSGACRPGSLPHQSTTCHPR